MLQKHLVPGSPDGDAAGLSPACSRLAVGTGLHLLACDPARPQEELMVKKLKSQQLFHISVNEIRIFRKHYCSRRKQSTKHMHSHMLDGNSCMYKKSLSSFNTCISKTSKESPFFYKKQHMIIHSQCKPLLFLLKASK